MAKLFFHFSGEAGNLPFGECISILEVEKAPIRIIKKLDQVLVLDSDKEKCKKVTERAAYTYR
ncbi:MAG: hypothetical protein ACTSQY_04040, partial [Candidatus Odinarchaeia archaeon]